MIEREKTRPMTVGVAGLGIVGGGAALYLANDGATYSLCGAFAKNRDKVRDSAFAQSPIATTIDEFLACNPDVVIDALPDGPTGKALIERVFGAGRSVITANKQAIAGSLADLTRKARENRATFLYSAAVGGGAPMIETIQYAVEKGEIRTIAAILNGTVNYILSAVEEGTPFEDALAAAQEAGLAEPDPSADLSGEDARAKVSILSFVAFGKEIPLPDIEIEALTPARRIELEAADGVWRQVATLEIRDGTINARVVYQDVTDDLFFRTVKEEGNALRAHLTDGQVFACKGRGAGRKPTVASLVSDLRSIRPVDISYAPLTANAAER